MITRKFSKGDRILVLSNCMSKGRKGTVIGYTIEFGQERVSVRLDSGIQLSYNESSLKKIGKSQTEEKQEDNNVASNEVQGNYKVAMVRHCEGNTIYQKNGRVYAFAMFDDEVAVGDKVLCDSEGGYSVADVIEVLTKEEYSQAHSRVVTKEIICRVDFSNFDKRLADRKAKAIIKAEMDKILADSQDLLMYQAVAASNPVMAELLERYKKLSGME